MKKRVSNSVWLAALSLLAAVALATTSGEAATLKERLAAAMNDGVLWTKVKGPGNTLCFADHFHYGSGSVQPTKAKAEADAIAAWAGFVDFEYGAAYADFRIAASKSVKCHKAEGGIKCMAEARPCRRY
jgi:hypothetical protein